MDWQAKNFSQFWSKLYLNRRLFYICYFLKLIFISRHNVKISIGLFLNMILENIQKDNEERSERINDLINQMTTVSENNDGDKLADFRPPPYAVNNKNGEEKLPFMHWQPKAEDEIEMPENEMQQPVPKIQAHNDLVYGPSYTNTKFGNFRRDIRY